MITFSKADVIPLGEHGDKLGMTRYEILEMAQTYNAYFGSGMELFLTIIFGYIVAMYLVAPNLSQTQYTIANTVFIAVMANHVLFLYRTVVTSLQWNAWDGYYGDEMYSLLAVWFGWRIRKDPPQDRLNLLEAIE